MHTTVAEHDVEITHSHFMVMPTSVIHVSFMLQLHVNYIPYLDHLEYEARALRVCDMLKADIRGCSLHNSYVLSC